MKIQLLLFAITLSVAAACANAPSPSSASATPQASPQPSPKQISTADLNKLRWIEGSWRGTGGGVDPFFERYKFENDSTLVVETLADETLSKVSDVGRFELKNGNFGTTSGEAGSVAIALDDTSITFAPVGKARNFFRWQKESDNAWKAILTWTDKDGNAKERVYNLERWPTKK